MDDKKYKPILLYDKEAVRLIHAKAEIEGRCLSNAAARTIIESLSPKLKQQIIDKHLGLS